MEDVEELSVCTSPWVPPAMMRSQWSVEQFQIHKQIYEGRTSRLFFATDKQSGIPVALKLYRKMKLTALGRLQVEREINIHIGICHENVIKLYAAFEDNKYVYLVLEVAEGGDLFHQVQAATRKQYSERKAVQNVMMPFLNAIMYLHSKGIVHRDIKPENILLMSDGTLKLADFGLAIDIFEERPVTRLGTLDYMAPEVLLCPDKKYPEENKDRKDITYSSQVDVWALGVLAYEVLSGHAPFQHSSRTETYEHILKHDPEYPSHLSDEAVAFIKAALHKDPQKRPSAAMLMEHFWIKANAKQSRTASYNDISAFASGSCDLSVSSGAFDSCSSSRLVAELLMENADPCIHLLAAAAASQERRPSSTTPVGGASSLLSHYMSSGLAELARNMPSAPYSRQVSVPILASENNAAKGSSGSPHTHHTTSHPDTQPRSPLNGILDTAPPPAVVPLPPLFQRTQPNRPIDAVLRRLSSSLATNGKEPWIKAGDSITGTSPPTQSLLAACPRVVSQPIMGPHMNPTSDHSLSPSATAITKPGSLPKATGPKLLGLDFMALLSRKQKKVQETMLPSYSSVMRSSASITAAGNLEAGEKGANPAPAAPPTMFQPSLSQVHTKSTTQRQNSSEVGSIFGALGATDMFIQMQHRPDPDSHAFKNPSASSGLPRQDSKPKNGLVRPSTQDPLKTKLAHALDSELVSRVHSLPKLFGTSSPRPSAPR